MNFTLKRESTSFYFPFFNTIFQKQNFFHYEILIGVRYIRFKSRGQRKLIIRAEMLH